MTIDHSNSVSVQCLRIGRAFRCQLEKHAQGLGLTATEVMLLHILSGLGTSTLGELARKLGLAHPSVLRHIDALQDADYLVRKPHPTDRRVKQVMLTSKGRGIVDDLQSMLRLTESMAVHGIHEDDRAELLLFLNRIMVNLTHGIDCPDDA